MKLGFAQEKDGRCQGRDFSFEDRTRLENLDVELYGCFFRGLHERRSMCFEGWYYFILE